MHKDRENLIISINTKYSRLYFNKSAVSFLNMHNLKRIDITTTEICSLHKGIHSLYSYQGAYYLVSTKIVRKLMSFFTKKSDFTLLVLTEQTESGNFELVLYDEKLLSKKEQKVIPAASTKKKPRRSSGFSRPSFSSFYGNQISRILRQVINS